MSTPHTTACTDTTVHLNGIQYPGTIARCSCGWSVKWSIRDGSAEADAAAHEAKYNKRHGEDITLKVIDEGQPGIIDLSTPENRKLAADALPALLVGGMLGNHKAAETGVEIITGILAEALKPSVEAMNLLNTIRRKDQK